MCSIIGFEKKTYSPEEIQPFFQRTKSRGPDSSRFMETPSGYLGFHRLAIMGLDESGMQPFTLGSDAIVCNGEIYGWRKLRKKLDSKYQFVSESDCEILLPLYNELGTDMFSELGSEFALVLYDGRQDKLIAARDPIGIRPLYYGYDKMGGIVFASEAKNLEGMCKRIKPFPPGHYYEDGEFHSYLDITQVSSVVTDDLDTVCEQIRAKLIHSV